MTMQNTSIKNALGGLLVLAALAGCAAKAPQLEQRLGEATAAAKAQQTINPEASRNTNPVAGLDGQAANDVIDQDHKSYKQPPAPVNIFNIGVGSSSGGTGK